ncbi:hypothetical protein D3C86_1859570 [compost metagenome]
MDTDCPFTSACGVNLVKSSIERETVGKFSNCFLEIDVSAPVFKFFDPLVLVTETSSSIVSPEPNLPLIMYGCPN